MKLRPWLAADVPSVARLWNACLGETLREPILQLTVLQDPTLRKGDALLATEGGAVLAAAWLKRWREPYAEPRFARTGFLGGIAVLPEHQRHGIGSALLEALEERLRAEHCDRAEVSGGLLHLLPGVPASATRAKEFFEHRGYLFGPEEHVDLTGDPAAAGLPVQGVRPARGGDELLAFLAREFPGSWHLHARWHLSAGGRPRDFMVLDQNGAVEGFCHIFRPGAWPPGPSTYWPGNDCGLGPIGVSARLRGSGLGRKLMHGSLNELARAGGRRCVIDWTRLVDFYARFGFQPCRAYLRAAKQL